MSKLMPEILHLTLHREFFDAIASNRKRIEVHITSFAEAGPISERDTDVPLR